MSGEITYMKKLLSIIIPSYNMEKYLPKCRAGAEVFTVTGRKFQVGLENYALCDFLK